jgi:hypothetical protein
LTSPIITGTSTSGPITAYQYAIGYKLTIQGDGNFYPQHPGPALGPQAGSSSDAPSSLFRRNRPEVRS